MTNKLGEEDVSIRDEIAAAMVEETPVSTEAESDAPVSNRDEAGRFKAKAQVQTEDSPPPAASGEASVEQQPAAGTWSTDRAPSSWTPAAREKWATIPPDLQAEIIRREEASVNGVRQMQERVAPVQQFLQDMSPYVQEAQSMGVNFQQHVSSVLNTERALRTLDMPSKFQALLGIADQYGIPLREIVNESVGRQVLEAPQQQVAQLPPEFQQQMQELTQWRDNLETQQVNAAVGNFGTDKEFFNDVRGLMADLIERGMAQDLNSAYDQACWMNQGVREVLLSRQAAPAKSPVAERQVAAARASVRPGSKITVPDDEDSDASIADTIRAAYVTGSTGRI